MGEMHQTSGWNLVDFMKSLVIAPTLHSSNWRVFAKTLAFIILGGFHRWNLGEICQISQVKSTRFQGEIPHPAFIKLKSFCWNTCFYNFGWISQVISGWNLPDFRVKSARFQGWNPPDFKVEIRRISWTWAFGWWSSIGLSIERPINGAFNLFKYVWGSLNHERLINLCCPTTEIKNIQRRLINLRCPWLRSKNILREVDLISVVQQLR